MPDTATLGASAAPLTERYDSALFDLDGVLYVQSDPVPYAAEGVQAARAAGMRIGFVTNNASRRPAEVAELLIAVGVEAAPNEIVTSSQASAALLAERLPAGAPVLIVGARALSEEVAEVGLTPVWSADENPAAVVQGYSPDVGWRMLAEAAVAVRNGAYWVATNADSTLPSARGPLPGNGSLVAALATALRHGPDEIVGKPHPRLHLESVRRIGAREPLVVGDRIDTDIEGARASGADSLLVLTGVSRPSDVLSARPDARPTYLAEDLRGLTAPHPEVAHEQDTIRCGGWWARSDSTALELGGSGSSIDALRALAVASWQRDADGAPEIKPTGDPAGEVVRGLFAGGVTHSTRG